MNPYKVLQVDPSAEPEVIEGAYKRLAAKYHPDKNPSASAAVRMKEINAAYEILKDSPRRARHEPGVEQASNRVVKELLGVGALVCLFIYVPRLAFGAAVMGGTVWLLWRYPGPIRKIVKVTAVVGIAAAIRYFFHEHAEARRNKQQLAALHLPTLFGRKLDEFRSGCVTKANRTIPEQAAPYCSCLADVLRTRFDMSPINTESAEEYRRVVSTRFEAAVPGEDEQEACAERVRPKAVPGASPQ